MASIGKQRAAQRIQFEYRLHLAYRMPLNLRLAMRMADDRMPHADDGRQMAGEPVDEEISAIHEAARAAAAELAEAELAAAEQLSSPAHPIRTEMDWAEPSMPVPTTASHPEMDRTADRRSAEPASSSSSNFLDDLPTSPNARRNLAEERDEAQALEEKENRARVDALAAEKGAAERFPEAASTSTGSLELRSTDLPTPALQALPRTPIGVDLLVQQWSPPVPDTPERPVPDTPEPPSQRLRATASQSTSSLPRAIVRRVVTTKGVPDDAALGTLPRLTSSEQRALAPAPAPAPREPSPVQASPSSSAARPRIVNQERANELAAALAAAPAGPRGRSPRPGSGPLSPPPGTEL